MLSGLAAEEAEDLGETWPPEGTSEDELHAEAQAQLPESAVALYRFWQAKRPPATIRREGDKIGRNDPCPCGSGKKYKQCCGLDA